MKISRLILKNWRNFKNFDERLSDRVFIIGPNASGKSNLLDALRFLKTIAEPEGGFQRAIALRGGVPSIRCLHARQSPSVVIDVEIQDGSSVWRYKVEFSQDRQRRPMVRGEAAWCNEKQILSRPNSNDQSDLDLMTQTHLEQVSANKEFRVVAEFLADIRYLHLVPQLVRESDRVLVRQNDPFGSDFIDQLARTPIKQRRARLRKISDALRIAVPQLAELQLESDKVGIPHLKARYEHWRPKAGWQTEEHLSDGTIRLIGLLWALLSGTAPLLLEEPELSLHTEVIRQIPSMMSRATHSSGQQIFVSSHSPELLTDEGIAPEEVILLSPTAEGTESRLAASLPTIRSQLETGLSIGEAVIPLTAPKKIHQLSLFGA